MSPETIDALIRHHKGIVAALEREKAAVDGEKLKRIREELRGGPPGNDDLKRWKV